MSKLKKKRRKPSGRGTAKKVLDFRNKLDGLKYNKMSEAEILEEILEEGLQMPKRATPENALQDQYKYISPTGYADKVNTGMMGEFYTEKGSCWVSIINTETKKVVWRREFYHTAKNPPLDKLSAYAHLVKNIADNRPSNMDLVPVGETRYIWKSKDGKSKEFLNIADYLHHMTDEDKEFILKNEQKRNDYLRRTRGKVRRQRTIQKTWKKKK